MSIPELTPVETPIFDELVIEQMQNHLDDAITCDACGDAAVIRLSARCCGQSAFKCTAHETEWRDEVTAKLGWLVKCFCGQVHRLSFDLYRVVPL